MTKEESTPVSLRLPNEQLKYLKKMSHYMSIEQDADLSYVDLIRTAIDTVYPMPVGATSENKDD